MNQILPGEKLLVRSRRLFIGAFALVLLGLAGVVIVVTLHIRHGIREQIAGRDAEVLHAVASMYYAADVEEGLAGPLNDVASQLSVVLRASELRGVLGVRIYDPAGNFLVSFPPDVTEAALDKRHLPVLKKFSPSTSFHPAIATGQLFYTAGKTTPASIVRILEVNTPLHLPRGDLDGIAQFLLEGQSISEEYALLDRRLALEATAFFLASAVFLGLPLAWVYRRLRRAHQLVSQRTRDLVQANRELALSARTSALGAITAHLLHGLKNPLAGVESYIVAQGSSGDTNGNSEWRQAVASTQRIQQMVREVVQVIREEQSGAQYELSVPELLEQIRQRVKPLAAQKEVTIRESVQGDCALPNRAANLVLLVIVNLLENAVQATPPGGVVTLLIAQTDPGIAFRVEDSGLGFPAQVPLFMPCHSTKPGGSGIGLALCHELAQHLGAELSLSKNTPQGCEFSLILPTAAHSNPRVTAARPVAAPLILMTIALLSGAGAHGIDFPLRWRWSNPLPHGGNIVDMAYLPSIPLCVQVAERGQVYTSSDLDLWIPRESGTTAALRAVTFFGARILITGETGTVLYADSPDLVHSGVLLSGPTSAWLEAVAASSSLAVVAGDSGSVYSTSDGVHWSKQNSGTSAWLRGAAYGSGVFVLAGDAGTILRSTNGVSWSKRTSNTSSDLNRVCFAYGRFTVVGDGGVVVSSTNAGASWFIEQTGATNALQAAASSGTDRVVAGDRELRLLQNNAWTDQLARTNGPPSWTYYTAIGRPGFFLLAGQTGLQAQSNLQPGYVWDWRLTENSVRNWLWDATHLPAFYITVGDFGTIMTSGNGVDWTLELPPAEMVSRTLLGIGGSTNLLIAVGDGGAVCYSPNILTNVVVTNASGVVTQTISSLGVLWRPVPSFTTNDLQGVAVLNDSLYVVAGGKGAIFTSPDGLVWTRQTSPTTNFISSIVSWPGGLVACGDNGTLLSSKDGIKWSGAKSLTPNWLYKVRWLNGRLIAVGQGGTIFTSTDSVSWSNRTSGTSSWLTDAAFIEDTWFVTGLNGTVLSSSNLVAWIPRGSITQKHFYAAASDSQQLICLGVEGIILRSQVVPDLTPVSILDYSRVRTNASPPEYNVFLFGGKPDQRFTLDRSTNLLGSAWTTGPQLEIGDGSGTLYYVETLFGTNLPSAEYYRGSLVNP